MRLYLSFAKVWFVLSLLVLAFGYGFVSHAWELFPKTYIEQAWRQARSITQSNPGIFTGAKRYDRMGVRLENQAEVQPGLTLVTSSWKDSGKWRPELRLISTEGQVIHKWRINRKDIVEESIASRGDVSSKIHGSYLLPDGDIVINLEYYGMARLNACGDVLWKVLEGNHHSIAEGEGQSFWTPGVSETPRSTTEIYPDGFPGMEGRELWVDRVLHISSDGKVLDDINVLDVLFENGLERYIPKVTGGLFPSKRSVPTDVTHLNDVEPLPESIAGEYPIFEAGDLLVSLRSLSLVFVFDPETMEVKWHSSDPFIYQHDPDFTGNGWIGVFDNNYDFNGGKTLGGSRILALQPHTDSLEVRFPTQHSERFYTGLQGKWQRLNNGNMLLSEADAGRVVEVNNKGETVWEWIHEPINDSSVPKVTNATRHDLTREEIASWPCSSIDSVSTSAQ